MDDTQARDLIILGSFLVLYGILSWYTQRTPPPSLDMKRLTFVRSRRDELIREEQDG